ncbi:MAG: hypothetical protein AUK51_00190 [Comamonadaceae bacterium CG2_30_59_20]|nr:MAG: hypothetical protein AUK51_00190 [Comamonadaceae bacterium CG2_30_59_20]
MHQPSPLTQTNSTSSPPVDVDIDLLDEDLLVTLASRWNLEPQLHQWKSMAQTANFGEDRTDEGVTQIVGPTSGAVALATEARARMMARKSVKPA